jgi:hypothetical protein
VNICYLATLVEFIWIYVISLNVFDAFLKPEVTYGAIFDWNCTFLSPAAPLDVR